MESTTFSNSTKYMRIFLFHSLACSIIFHIMMKICSTVLLFTLAPACFILMHCPHASIILSMTILSIILLKIRSRVAPFQLHDRFFQSMWNRHILNPQHTVNWQRCINSLHILSWSFLPRYEFDIAHLATVSTNDHPTAGAEPGKFVRGAKKCFLCVKSMIGSAPYNMLCTNKYGRKNLRGPWPPCPPVAPPLSYRPIKTALPRHARVKLHMVKMFNCSSWILYTLP